MKLDIARTIIAGTLEHARAEGLKPMGVVVLDAGGHIVAAEREDDASPGRIKVAEGKANACLMLGIGGAALLARGANGGEPFLAAMNGLFDGRFVPVPGGVLVKDDKGRTVGAVGASGDLSDKDAAAVLAGIGRAGLTGIA